MCGSWEVLPASPALLLHGSKATAGQLSAGWGSQVAVSPQGRASGEGGRPRRLIRVICRSAHWAVNTWLLRFCLSPKHFHMSSALSALFTLLQYVLLITWQMYSCTVQPPFSDTQLWVWFDDCDSSNPACCLFEQTGGVSCWTYVKLKSQTGERLESKTHQEENKRHKACWSAGA